MVFNSLSFAVFLAVVLLLYQLPFRWRTHKLVLLVASYVFYMAWNPPFVVLLWISTGADWFIARALHRSEGPARRRRLVVASLAVNLGLLGFFKYSGFAVDNLVALLAAFGVEYHPAAPDVILPLGISFYTFQTLSYTLDVYRRVSAPCDSFVDYALYVTFFPQLVAGPIVRSRTFLPQCTERRRASANEWTWGLSLLTLGLFQKIVLADALLAPVAEAVFDGSAVPGAADAWVGTLAFSGQIFCDFSGYSSCAIGVALCLGFLLPENFAAPYTAIGFSDFWRRWHVSLSSWLRDYLYISLGGNRRGRARTYVNLMLTMLIGGLWHGASWSFVVWGGLHGVYLVVERFVRETFPALWNHALGSRRGIRFGLGLATFAVVSATWVFFRAADLTRALEIGAALFGAGPADAEPLTTYTLSSVLFVVGSLLVAHAWLRDVSLRERATRSPWWLQTAALALMWIAIIMTPGSDRAFIYFQF